MDRQTRPRDPTDRSPRIVAVFAGGTLALSTLILVISSVLATGPAYRISGTIIGSPHDTKTLLACQDMILSSDPARIGKTWTTRLDPKLGTIILSMEAVDTTVGATEIDTFAQEIVDRLNAQSATRAAIDPAIAVEETRLRNLIAECDREIAAASQPAVSPPDRIADLLVSLQQTLTERRKTAGRLKEIASQLKEPAPTIAQVTLTTMPTTLPASNGPQILRRLQADVTAFHQRQARLTELLRELLETSLSRLEAARSTVDESAMRFAGTVSTDAEKDVRHQLETIQEALKTWSTAAGELATTWTSKRDDLQAVNEDFDGPACQAGVEAVAMAFLDHAGKVREQIQAALAAIREGGDEPTKRIILHRNTSQQIQPALEAIDQAHAAMRLIRLNDNAQLSAMVKMVASLRDRVADQRGEIESQLRDHTLQELRATHEAHLSSLRLQQDQAQQQASELETTMIARIAEIAGHLADLETHRQSMSRSLHIQQRRGTLLQQLAKLLDTPAPEQPTALRYQPAQITAILTPPSRGLVQNLRVGLGPMLTSFIALAGVWWWLRSRQAAGALDDLTQELKMASRHERGHR